MQNTSSATFGSQSASKNEIFSIQIVGGQQQQRDDNVASQVLPISNYGKYLNRQQGESPRIKITVAKSQRQMMDDYKNKNDYFGQPKFDPSQKRRNYLQDPEDLVVKENDSVQRDRDPDYAQLPNQIRKVEVTSNLKLRNRDNSKRGQNRNAGLHKFKTSSVIKLNSLQQLSNFEQTQIESQREFKVTNVQLEVNKLKRDNQDNLSQNDSFVMIEKDEINSAEPKKNNFMNDSFGPNEEDQKEQNVQVIPIEQYQEYKMQENGSPKRREFTIQMNRPEKMPAHQRKQNKRKLSEDYQQSSSFDDESISDDQESQLKLLPPDNSKDPIFFAQQTKEQVPQVQIANIVSKTDSIVFFNTNQVNKNNHSNYQQESGRISASFGMMNLNGNQTINKFHSHRVSPQSTWVEKRNVNNQSFEQSELNVNNFWNQGYSPKEAMQRYSKELTEFEKVEMEMYKIYTIGRVRRQNQFSISNKDGHYMIAQGEQLGYGYEVIRVIDSGAFGQVIKCVDYKDPQYRVVAIKISKNKKFDVENAMVELNIIQKLQEGNDFDNEGKEFIVEYIDSFKFRQHVVMVFECLSLNLYEYQKLNKRRRPVFTADQLRSIARQTCQGLKYMKNQEIIHCDIKPENILFTDENSNRVKLIDFGTSCKDCSSGFFYVQSRYYRCPEIVLGIKYDHAVDMWSFGCILYELIVGQPLFPAEDENALLEYFTVYLGHLPKYMIKKGKKYKQFYRQNDLGDDELIRSQQSAFDDNLQPSTQSLNMFLEHHVDSKVIDFIKKCLTIEPEDRLTPQAALHHAWLIEL